MKNVYLAWSWDLGCEKYEADRARASNTGKSGQRISDSKAGLKGWDQESQTT